MMSNIAVHQASAEEHDNCAREAIHETVLLQPHGFMIAFDAHTGLLVFASSNASDFLFTDDVNLLGRPISTLIDGSIETALAQLDSLPAGSPIAVDIRFSAACASLQRSEVLIHRSGDRVIIEVMPYREAVHDADIHLEFERALRELGSLQRHVLIDDFLQACALEIRRLSGYQRVMIYRFLPDWCGEVIAESCDEAVDMRFLGLRFPATDIPEQARTLYKKNLLRIIGDVKAAPNELRAGSPGEPLDLSHSLLRQPSAMHLKYLENMDVRATLTISLLKDGELWGMVACHHPEPKTPPLQLRRVTKLLCSLAAEIVMVRLDALARQASEQRNQAFRNAPNQMSLEFNTSQDFAGSVSRGLSDLTRCMNVQTYGLFLEGTWVCRPELPPAFSDFLIKAAQSRSPDDALVTHQVAVTVPGVIDEWAPWSGVMVLPVPGWDNSYLVFVRQKLLQQVNWAGAPSKRLEKAPSGLNVLGPRTSFERWTQQVQGQSEPWDSSVCEASQAMAKAISEVYRMHQTQKMQAELHLLGSYMEHLNDMVVVTDTTTLEEPGPRIVYVNEAFVRRTGYRRDEVMGRSPRILQGAQTQRSQLDALRVAMQTWSPITVELINYTKTGEPFWVELSLTSIANSPGQYTHWVAIERDITERKRAESEIQKLANYDPLTGLPNRRMLMERLEVALRTSQRHKRNGALLFIDLDNFKDLNDTAGHHLGDALLKQAAQRLVEAVRVQDMVARLGGDEFVVMLEDLSLQTDQAANAAQQVAQKIVATLGQSYHLDGQEHFSTASLGIALFVTDHQACTVEDLLKQSDFAMYQAKGAGRNTCRFFDPATQAALVLRNGIEADLKDALAQGQLESHYQIIVDRERQVTGVEVLLRWKHPTRGWVSPVDFIPIAEQSGLILSIGEWVLRSACDLLALWAETEDRRHWTMAVNVSARQVSQAGFVDLVRSLVARSGCNPALLKLELTESLLQHDVDATVAKMDALRALGVQFSIDDFGTGYSSLTYLRRLPVSVLKIDRSFVRDIETDEGDRAICQTVMALGHTLNMSIVAEGVETPAQFAFLESNGCDRFQGFLFGRPVPLAQL